jgi:hypothetical protein
LNPKFGPHRVAEAARLRLAAEAAARAVALHREWLVESLGDRMCGSGWGPGPAEIEALAGLEQAERAARRRLSHFLSSASVSGRW